MATGLRVWEDRDGGGGDAPPPPATNLAIIKDVANDLAHIYLAPSGGALENYNNNCLPPGSVPVSIFRVIDFGGP